MKAKMLNKKEIDNIKALAREKLVEFCKLNDVIGAQVFNILEKESHVLYYPLEDQAVWGFSEKVHGKAFVCINTSLDYDKQVFAAAHELYHLWYGNAGEVLLPEAEYEEEELKANRFASEFLINEELLLQEMRIYNINKACFELKDIVRLAHLFVVPYQTMVKRLFDIGVCKESQMSKLAELSEEQLATWKKRLGLLAPIHESKIGLSNLLDMAVDLYEKKLITYAKLDYLLAFAEVTPEELGIKEPSEYIPPTEAELDALMEE